MVAQTETQRTSTVAELDAAVEAIHAEKDTWVQTDIPARLAILDQLQTDLRQVLPEWVRASLEAKDLRPDQVAAGDEWVFASILFRHIRVLRKSLQDIQEHGRPQIPGKLRTREDGQVVAPAFPLLGSDRILYNGLRGEVWMRPGITEDEVLASQASIYRDKAQPGRVALVLGAGNASMLVPGDFMHKLFNENQVVVLKMNPVNDYLGPIIEKGYRALIEPGFLRVVYGGVDEAQHLIAHDLVDELHMTGSDKTHDAIVFGTGDAGQRNKEARTPVMTKPFTSELGNVTPVIIVPGPWTADDIRYQAVNLASMLASNAGFNCLTPRVLINHAGWNLRDSLNQAIHNVLEQVPPRTPYYPGAEKRHAAFLQAHPDAGQHGDPFPWTFIDGVDASNPQDIAFQEEAFCGLFAETALEGETPAAFIDRAVEFANTNIWGTLTAIIIVHPDSYQDAEIVAALDRAKETLRYGSVGINAFGALSYLMMSTPWGGHAGQDIFDVQSGIGVVNNTLMFAHPQKTVVWQAFRSPLNSSDPINSNFNVFGEKIARFEADRSLMTGAGLFWALLRN